MGIVVGISAFIACVLVSATMSYQLPGTERSQTMIIIAYLMLFAVYESRGLIASTYTEQTASAKDSVQILVLPSRIVELFISANVILSVAILVLYQIGA